jgi:hypothetical protein
MARRARTAQSVQEVRHPRFEGTRFSNAECEFLMEHLGESVMVCLAEDVELPDGVNEVAVESILKVAYDLEQYQQAQRVKLKDDTITTWVGLDALRKVLQDTIDWRATVAELKQRTKHSNDTLKRAAAAPSLHLWDPDTDIPYLGGVGADSDIVMTALGPGGTRIPLHTELHTFGEGSIQSLAGVAKFVKARTQMEAQDRLQNDTPSALIYRRGDTTGTVECPVCGKGEEFILSQEATKRAAETRILQHLKSTQIKTEKHRLLKLRLQSGRAGRGRKPEVEEAE